MGRKRPRPPFTAQLLVVTTFAIPPLLPRAFLPSAAPLHCGSAIHSSTRTASHLNSSSKLSRRPGTTAVQPLRAVPHRRRNSRRGWEEKEEEGDPNDPLPRTMEELYRRMQSAPPTDQRPSEDDAIAITPDDEDTIAEVFDKLIAPMGDDSWWEENQEEWDRIASDPAASFTSVDQSGKSSTGFSWGLQGRFGESAPDWQPSDEEAAPFSLSAYKAGTMLGSGRAKERAAGTSSTSSRTGAGGSGAWAGGLEGTPFAEYWDSLPDIGVTKRVYAFNAVDRMAALKFLMNCTCNGIHGSPEEHQAGHFLWGYVDQLDWMRRSGRLSSKPGSIKVDEQSWWGRVSYTLTIVPLAAAAESGLCDEGSVSILGGDDLQLPEMQRAVRAWRRVWLHSDADIATRVLLDMPVHDSLMERVRRAQWAAHVESLDAVEALYKKEFDALPSSAEREFARGWCRASRLLAVAAAHTNLDRLLLPLGAGYPPERYLTDSNACDAISEDSLEGVPYGPLYLVEEAKADPAVALGTRRCVKSFRWLGNLRAPAFATLRFLWRRACVSYPARRGAARVLRGACLGGKRAKAAAWGKLLVFTLIPDLNYRKLTPPFGVDPAEEVEYDPDMPLRDPAKLPKRPAGSRPLNPLQWPWYDGRRPDPAAVGGTGEAEGGGWDEDDDGLGSSAGGMFPSGKVPTDIRFDTLQQRKENILRIVRKAEARRRQREGPEGNSEASGGEGGRGGRGAGDAGGGREFDERSAADGESSSSTVFV